jgi:hypothetical protein
MRDALILAAALALGALPAAAAPVAAPDPTTTDLRCLMISAMLAQSDAPDLKDIGTLSLYYFWGRLEGRVPPSDVAQRLIDQAKAMSPEDLKTEARGCADMSRKAGQSLSDISDALQKSLGPPPSQSSAAPQAAPTGH